MATLGTALMGALGHSDEEKMFRPWSVFFTLKTTHPHSQSPTGQGTTFSKSELNMILAERRWEISFCMMLSGGMPWRTLSSMD